MREYIFGMMLTDEEYDNLRNVGKIINENPEFVIKIKIDPDDLVPVDAQDSVRTFLANSLNALNRLRPGKRFH